MSAHRKPADLSRIAQLWEIVGYAYRAIPEGRWRILACAALGLLELCVVVLLPLITARIVNSLVRRSAPDFQHSLILLLCLTLAQVMCSLASQLVGLRIDERVGYGMRRLLLTNVLSRDLRFFDEFWVGDIISRVLNDSTALKGVFTEAVLRIAFDLITIVGVFAVMMFLNPALAFLTVVAVPVSLAFGRKAGPLIESSTRVVREKIAAVTGGLQSWLVDPASLKTHSLEAEAGRQFDRQNRELMQCSITAGTLRAGVGVLGSLLYGLPSLFIFGYGGFGVLKGSLSVGDLFAFTTFTAYITAPIQRLSQIYLLGIPAQVAVFTRVKQLLSSASALPDTDPGVRTSLLGLSARNVHFSLSAGYKLNVTSLELQPGDIAGVVGPNGAGKTTLMRLLAGIYRPDAGEVAVEIDEPGETRAGDVRRLFAVLPQKVALFPGTLLENVTLFAGCVDKAKITALEERLGLKPWLASLKDGWQTSINPGLAEQFSGGQLQRIGIARILYSEAPIWILDEPATALDAGILRELPGLLLQPNPSRIVIVISHDSSLLNFCNKTYSIENDAADSALWTCGPAAVAAPAVVPDRELAACVAGGGGYVLVHSES
jgi:ABC-type bacteriocin/lantibiotic exporter with double-glycine peptidase domain